MSPSNAVSCLYFERKKQMGMATVGNKTVILLLIVVFIACGVDAEKLSRHKRTERKKTSEYDKVMNRGATVDCFDAMEHCKNNRECQLAMRGLKRKCKVSGGRCNAKMVDLPRCGKIMDDIHKHSFPPGRCRCKRDLRRCFQILNNVYANPCFDKAVKMRQRPEETTNGSVVKFEKDHINSTKKATALGSFPTRGTFTLTSEASKRVETVTKGYKTSITHLREKGLFPENLTAFHKVEGDLSNSGIGVRVPFKELDADYEESIEESIFGDEGFAEPPPSARTKGGIDSSIDDVNSKLNEPIKYKNKFDLELFAINGGKLSTSTQKSVSQKTAELSSTSNNSFLTPGRRVNYKLDHMEKELRASNANFKIMAIALGVILGVFVLTAIAGFAWSRSRGGFFYTGGKLVQRHNVNIEASVHSEKSDDIKPQGS